MVQLPVVFDDSSADVISMQQIFSGYQLLHDVDMLLQSLSGTSGTRFATDLIENVFQVITSFSKKLLNMYAFKDTCGYLPVKIHVVICQLRFENQKICKSILCIQYLHFIHENILFILGISTCIQVSR